MRFHGSDPQGLGNATSPHHHTTSHHSSLLIPLLLSLGLLAALYKLIASASARRRRDAKGTFAAFMPWDHLPSDTGSVIVCDCTHPKALTFSHHKGHRNPHGLKAADTSTGIVLNAITARSFLGGETAAYLKSKFVTTNHFDIDSFLSCWCYINRDLARQHEPVLRHMARIGDFREALLSPELVAKYGAEEGLTNVREAFTALKLCCWLNTSEIRLFSAPYETKDCQQKFEHFLQCFGSVLCDPESEWSVWQEEYKQVVAGFDQLQGPGCSVEVHRGVGLTVLHSPEPLHYYSLFSHTCGSDYVLSMYDHNRYELECKYTQFVQVQSRPVMPRLDFTALATVLNSMEEGQPEGAYWVAPRFTDSGPALRLESAGERLTKAQRYGHPSGRPFTPSSLPPQLMSAVVISFLEFGIEGCQPRRGGFSWDELHSLNQEVPWTSWVNAVLDQHDRGEFGKKSLQAERRMSTDAVHLAPAPTAPTMCERSYILSDEEVRLLAGTALPAHLAFGSWHLAYSTQRDGFSLHTMYRKAAGKSPTLLVVQDSGGYVFGAYASEPWKVHTRFYGTGETAVFQLRPRQLLWHWSPVVNGTANDYFQFSTHEGLGVGGSGAFAVWLDNDLFEGSSNPCNTFASNTLANSADFHVKALELWHVA